MRSPQVSPTLPRDKNPCEGIVTHFEFELEFELGLQFHSRIQNKSKL
jgi:hypothetical protein